MQFYRIASHTRYDIKLHFVWIRKYRGPILSEEVALRVRELVREICLANEVQILKGRVSRDHVHLFVSVPPSVSASKADAVYQRKDVSEGTDGVSTHKEEVLGRSYLGKRVLCGQFGECD